MTNNHTSPTDISVIFDFDGTIANSAVIFVEMFAGLLGRSPLSMSEREKLRNMGLSESIQYLDIKKWRLPFIIYRGRIKILKRMGQVEIFPGMTDVIRALSKNHGLRRCNLWGYNLSSALERKRPFAVVDTPKTPLNLVGNT